MKHLLPLVLLLTCFSGRVDVDTEATGAALSQALTVCLLEPGDREFADVTVEAVNYWWERGYAIDYTSGPYCLVRVRLAHTSHVPDRDCADGARSVDGWCNGEVGVETHQEYQGRPRIDGFAPATITIRLEPWERMEFPFRLQTIAHELGHSLGLHHSGEMPMRSCERDEWCFGETEVVEWYGSL